MSRGDDAVSPVIRVILMVAVTVILAAVIGTYVLGLGSNVVSGNTPANVTEVEGGPDRHVDREAGVVCYGEWDSWDNEFKIERCVALNQTRLGGGSR